MKLGVCNYIHCGGGVAGTEKAMALLVTRLDAVCGGTVIGEGQAGPMGIIFQQIK